MGAYFVLKLYEPVVENTLHGKKNFNRKLEKLRKKTKRKI